MELSEQEAHCVARLIQGGLYGKEIFDGCDYCKYQCLEQGGRLAGFAALRKRLTEETGVDVNPVLCRSDIDGVYPFHLFLKNANSAVKELFRKNFAAYSALVEGVSKQ